MKHGIKPLIEFTETEMIESGKSFYDNKTWRWIRPYYLSDTVPTSFDKSKVGKSKTGKYLVVLYYGDILFWETIIKLTPDTFIFFHKKTNAIGSCDHTFVYERIK